MLWLCLACFPTSGLRVYWLKGIGGNCLRISPPNPPTKIYSWIAGNKLTLDFSMFAKSLDYIWTDFWTYLEFTSNARWITVFYIKRPCNMSRKPWYFKLNKIHRLEYQKYKDEQIEVWTNLSISLCLWHAYEMYTQCKRELFIWCTVPFCLI